MILTACTERKTVQDENRILLKVGEKPNVEIFKNLFELETVLPVETTDEYLMTCLSRVIRYKEKLIILDDNSSIFVIDANTGKIENHIRHYGNAPGESRKIMDMAVDEDNENILVFNDYQKLIFYDLKGTFLKEEKFEKLYMNIICDNCNILFHNYGEGYSMHPYSIESYSLRDKTMKKIGEDKSITFPFKLYGRPVVKSKNIWFGSSLDFDLCRFEGNKIEKPYKLEPEISYITQERLDRIKSADDPIEFFYTEAGEFMYGISAIRETEHYLMFLSKSKHGGFFILNKATNGIYWEGPAMEDTDLGLKLYNYFPHDGDDNRIMFVVSAQEWTDSRKYGKGATADNLSKELKDRINSFNIREDDNPVLLFYCEKTQ
jgi:hypothetical protein